MIRAVVFDFYGTLTRSRSAAESTVARTELAAILGLNAARFDREMTATVPERFVGAGGDIAGSLLWVSQRLGVTPDVAALQRAAVRRLEHEREFGEPRPEAVRVLRALRERGLRIGVISDCSAELPVYFPDLEVAQYVDVPVFSYVTGRCKPAPENYLACCVGLGVEPAECLYVGDGGSDELAGARAMGLRSVHLSVPEEKGGLVYGRPASWDGETIRSLSEVVHLV